MAYGAVVLVGLLGAAHGWYLPGVAPHHFARGERAARMNFTLASRVAGSLYFRPFSKQRLLIGRGGFGASGPRH